jgi:Ca-activated chloride channel family protein
LSSSKDYYTLLGVPRNASIEQIRSAYREAALRLHPDKNVAPGETELFLEISQAYEVLVNPESRAEYDEELSELEETAAQSSPFQTEIIHSRAAILQIEEPLVHYVLTRITASSIGEATRAPINMAIVIDRSTSMKGARMDQVRLAVLAILEDLLPSDSATIVAFSDHAELIVSPEQSQDLATARARLGLLQASGGTEIGQGLQLGLDQLMENSNPGAISHLVLLTDGRTYGDDDLCLSLSDQAAEAKIAINCVGIGSDWSDRLLDDMASRTGGSVIFLSTPKRINELISRIYDSLTHTIARGLILEGALGQLVDLRSTFRLEPDPMPMGDSIPLKLGNLTRKEPITLLMEFVIHPTLATDQIVLANFTISGEILGQTDDEPISRLPLEIAAPTTTEPDAAPPPEDIVSALSQLAMYRLQEKARHEAELGQVSQAARRLESLATQLLANGERDLAKAALNEAVQLARSRRLSAEGEKVLKYGTRALMLPAPDKSRDS